MTFLVNGQNLNNRYLAQSMFVTAGNLFTWGYNVFGQLGTSDTTNRYSPVQIGVLNSWNNLMVSSSNSMDSLVLKIA